MIRTCRFFTPAVQSGHWLRVLSQWDYERPLICPTPWRNTSSPPFHPLNSRISTAATDRNKPKESATVRSGSRRIRLMPSTSTSVRFANMWSQASRNSRICRLAAKSVKPATAAISAPISPPPRSQREASAQPCDPSAMKAMSVNSAETKSAIGIGTSYG